MKIYATKSNKAGDFAMGAVNFSIDLALVKTLQASLPINILVETGTFRGETIETIKDYFENIYSVELSYKYYEQAKQKFQDNAHITIINGNSASVLKKLMVQLQNKAIIFWLDAHWCVATNTAGELSQCPLLAELEAIKYLQSDSVIIIDDARLFLATPPAPHEVLDWPSFDSVIKSLSQLSQSHNLMVLNDNILFYPNKIEKKMQLLAYQHGIDWLNILDKSRDYDTLSIQLKEKEQEIQLLKKICDEREEELVAVGNHAMNNYLTQLYNELYKIIGTEDKKEAYFFQPENALQAKEAIMDLQKKYLELYHRQQQMIFSLQHNTLKRYSNKILIRIKSFLSPKLGKLTHHHPKPIFVPERYRKKIIFKKFPTISVVTPTFNQGIFLERTIKSILEQGYKKLEYIVQDGGSTDHTLEILLHYAASLKHWESSPDGGQSSAINLGFRHTTGEIMAYLNSDDLLMPGTLNYIGHYFAKNPQVDVVYGHRVLIDENDQEIGRWVLPPHDSKVLSWADYIPQETLFWRRRIWEKIGGHIDESFYFAMDWDLVLRFRKAGATFSRLPRFLGAFRIHPHQKTSAQISKTGVEEMQRLREQCHGRPVTVNEIKKSIRSYLNRHLIYHNLYRAGILRY
jgi:glycosyltransferase involved in cell wall biosynthesis